MRLHIGKAFNSLKLTDYLEQEEETWLIHRLLVTLVNVCLKISGILNILCK